MAQQKSDINCYVVIILGRFSNRALKLQCEIIHPHLKLMTYSAEGPARAQRTLQRGMEQHDQGTLIFEEEFL